jgi:hypothetical protein
MDVDGNRVTLKVYPWFKFLCNLLRCNILIIENDFLTPMRDLRVEISPRLVSPMGILIAK